MISKDMRIEDAIKTNPNIIDILIDLKIDFCCKGYKNISEIALEKKLDLDSLVNLLNKQENTDNKLYDILKMDKDDLLDYIVDACFIKEIKLLNELDLLLQKLIKVHFDPHGEDLLKIYDLFSLLKKVLIIHFTKEEKIDFRILRRNEKIDVESLIKDHEYIGELLNKLEMLTNGYVSPSDGCETYVYTFKLLKELSISVKEHIFLENSILYK